MYFDFIDTSSILFKGILDIYLNTESKYDDIRLFHMPLLEMKIDLDWICKAQQQHSSLKKYLNKNLLNIFFMRTYFPDNIVNITKRDSR